MPDECTFVLLFCQEIFILTMLGTGDGGLLTLKVDGAANHWIAKYVEILRKYLFVLSMV